MKKYTINEALILLVRSAVCGGELPEELISSLTEEDTARLLALSTAQDLPHIIAEPLLGYGAAMNDQTLQSYKKSQLAAIFRHAQIRHEQLRIYSAFDEEKIRYIPLKGAVIRAYYPTPAMRTSCDVDIFVDKENLDAAACVLEEKLGYKLDERSSHDVAYYAPSQTHVELHFDLIENDARVSDVLSRVWEYSCPDEGSEYRYLMTNEMFVAYHIAHAAKHFTNGGCGVRPILDLWIAKHKMGYDGEALTVLLEKCGLSTFGEQAIRLSEVWFSGEEHTNLTRTMEEYILGTLLYGDQENRIAIMRVKRGKKRGYIISRIFLPYSKLKKIYPRLEKYPILLPFYEIKRWFRYFSRRGASRAIDELRTNGSLTEEKVEKIADLCKSLELV